jgi:hypothetical protein
LQEHAWQESARPISVRCKSAHVARVRGARERTSLECVLQERARVDAHDTRALARRWSVAGVRVAKAQFGKSARVSLERA